MGVREWERKGNEKESKCVCMMGWVGVLLRFYQLPLLNNLHTFQFRLHVSVHPHVPLEVTVVPHKGTKSPTRQWLPGSRRTSVCPHSRSPAPGRPVVVPCTWPYEEQTTGSMKS